MVSIVFQPFRFTWRRHWLSFPTGTTSLLVTLLSLTNSPVCPDDRSRVLGKQQQERLTTGMVSFSESGSACREWMPENTEANERPLKSWVEKKPTKDRACYSWQVFWDVGMERTFFCSSLCWGCTAETVEGGCSPATRPPTLQ